MRKYSIENPLLLKINSIYMISNATVNISLVYIWGQCKNPGSFYTDPKYANMEQAGLDPEYTSVLK